MKSPLISSKKVTLSSQFCYFDLLPLKKYQECSMRIPETVLLEKGFIKDWVFNSHKISNHPILKKRKENLATFAVVKVFCTKNGYGPAIQGCSNIRQIRQIVKQALKQQKDYDFIKDKKVIEITTVSNQILVMTLVDFLDYVSQNKYSQQNFYQKWKMIQEKVSHNKIDEYYKVENVRNNHVLESKCQKIISVNTTEATIHSTELQDDPYKNASPSKSFQIAETKNIEGYKFFDTFLNKKFFQMSAQLVEFIEKNLKCIVESVTTKFVINKEREPYLVSIADLQIKPAKKIADMKQFQQAKEKGYIKIEQYERCLQIYIHENLDKFQNYNIHTPLSERRKKCKGKFCKLHSEEVNLPPLMLQKLKMASMTAASRVVQVQLRDAVIKRRKRVIEKLVQSKVIKNNEQMRDESSQYQTQGDNDDSGYAGSKQKTKQLKVCQNCFIFYFHVNRFFDVDMYGNLTERKVVAAPNNQLESSLQKSQIKGLSFMSKQDLLKNRPKKNQASNLKLQELSEAFVNQKLEGEQKAQFQLDLQPITIKNKLQQPKLKHSNSNPKILSPIKRQSSLRKTQQHIKSQTKLPANPKSKVKLDPLNPIKQAIAQNSVANNPDTKGYRLLALTKISQPIKMQERSKSKTMHPGMLTVKEKRPQNFTQAAQQILKKLSALPDSSKEQLIYYAKKYYKDNLPQPIERRSYSTYYQPHLYEFMSTSPISIHPKRRIKKRPEMSLKRLSQLTDYPQIVSRSEFIFNTVIINEQTTIPYCILTTKVVNPDNIKSGLPFQNIFIINDIFDCFIEHISMAKQLLQEQEIYNKRVILFDYPGQSHTIYNRGNKDGFSAYFCSVLDKLVFNLHELKIIDLERDNYKFIGFGYGGNLLSTYLGSYSLTFDDRITGALLINSFMKYPKRYREILESLVQLYSSNDPTVQQKAHLYYNKAINSQQNSVEEMQHKAGLNPIRVQDRLYLLQCILNQYKSSVTTTNYTIQPQWFEDEDRYQISIIYGKNNTMIGRESAQQFIRYRKNDKQDIAKRVFVQIEGGHDILADNYEDIFRVLTLFARK